MTYKLFSVGALALILVIMGGANAQAQNAEECFFTPAVQTIPLYHAPLTHPTQQKDVVPAGRAYPITMQNGMHYYITFDDAYGGWVDRRSGGTSANCDAIPQDTTPIRDFPTICVLRTLREVDLYDYPQGTTTRGTLPEGTVLPVVYRYADMYYVLIDSAYGGWVAGDASSEARSGNCADLAYNPGTTFAYAMENARVWSTAGVDDGEVVTDIPEGTPLILVSSPVEGRIRTDTDDRGYWYQVALESDSPPLGWVWEGRLNFDTLPRENPTTARTLPEARLWSQPDVYSGEIITTLPPTSTVSVLDGPVEGIIRYDTGASGTWYQVETHRRQVGWIWAGRLAF